MGVKLSVIIPVYNEKDTILTILQKVDTAKIGNVDKEIILVDDCSTDGTRDILRGLKKHQVLYHEVNKGKGAAIRTGLEHASGDIMIVQDADLEYDPNDMKKLIEPILGGKTKVVYGSRFLGKKYKLFGKDRIILPVHYVGNQMLNFFTSIIYQTRITDMETCYKMFTKEAIRTIKLRANRFEFEPEITAKLLRSGHKILEIPISYNARGFGEGKKITWKDGVVALYYLMRYRFFD